MEKNALCISLLSGQFKAAAMQRGSIGKTYERNEPVDDLATFPAVLEEAAKQTGTDAKHVVMVLAHPRLSKQICEVPPVRGNTLSRYLQRRVQNLKSFDGDAAWSTQPAMPGKHSVAVLLHILPQLVLDQLMAGCESSDLQLVRVIPTTSVLASQLARLPIADHEIALIAAETGRTTTVVIGTRGGQVCLARVLGSNWNRKPDGVAMDIDRTIGFLNQDSGLTVNSVWLFGEGAEEQAPKLAATLSLPVRVSPVEVTPFYWAEQAATLPDQNDGNLIGADVRQAPQRRQLLAATVALTFLLCVASLAAAAYFEHLRRLNVTMADQATREVERLQIRLRDAEQRDAALNSKRGLSDYIRTQALPPVPAWFLGYVGEVVPDNFLLNQLRVARATGQWQLTMNGTLQPIAASAPASKLRDDFSSLTNALVTGPFHVKITRSQITETTVGTPNAPRSVQFVIEGVMQ